MNNGGYSFKGKAYHLLKKAKLIQDRRPAIKYPANFWAFKKKEEEIYEYEEGLYLDLSWNYSTWLDSWILKMCMIKMTHQAHINIKVIIKLQDSNSLV